MNAQSDWTPYLHKGERILWTGCPARRLFVFQPGDLFMVPFSLVWAVGASGAFFSTGFPSLVGLLFGALAIYITIGRFVVDAYIRRRTAYALTDRRALIARSAWGKDIREQPLSAALGLSFRGRGEGALTFGQTIGVFSYRGQMAVWGGEDGSFTFRAIPDPEDVFHMAQRAKEARP